MNYCQNWLPDSSRTNLLKIQLESTQFAESLNKIDESMSSIKISSTWNFVSFVSDFNQYICSEAIWKFVLMIIWPLRIFKISRFRFFKLFQYKDSDFLHFSISYSIFLNLTQKLNIYDFGRFISCPDYREYCKKISRNYFYI